MRETANDEHRRQAARNADTPEGAVGGGGGEYPLQDGFGWTNGVTRKLLHEAPANRNCHARAGRHGVHRHRPGGRAP